MCTARCVVSSTYVSSSPSFIGVLSATALPAGCEAGAAPAAAVKAVSVAREALPYAAEEGRAVAASIDETVGAKMLLRAR